MAKTWTKKLYSTKFLSVPGFAITCNLPERECRGWFLHLAHLCGIGVKVIFSAQLLRSWGVNRDLSECADG